MDISISIGMDITTPIFCLVTIYYRVDLIKYCIVINNLLRIICIIITMILVVMRVLLIHMMMISRWKWRVMVLKLRKLHHISRKYSNILSILNMLLIDVLI